MAKDADGDYYYEAGTVNELFDELSLLESDSGKLAVETADGKSRLGGDGIQLTAETTPPANSEFDNTEQRFLYISDGTGPGAAGDLMLARADGSDGVEAAVVASPGTYNTA